MESAISFLPFIILAIPFMIVNGFMAEKKGKNKMKFILLSIIPFVGLYLTIYLLSFLDKNIEDKINRIYEKLNNEQKLI
ncbi:MAG: hypothetical protein LBV69_03875 [Bacteroidales bacterium]|jgi:hypothetical protein|nr:hypothetical protein [Bacteroidales bacterium]